MEKLEVGKIYDITHERKGTFRVKITSVDLIWATGVLIKGKTSAKCAYNEKLEGDEITFKLSLATSKEVNFSPLIFSLMAKLSSKNVIAPAQAVEQTEQEQIASVKNLPISEVEKAKLIKKITESFDKKRQAEAEAKANDEMIFKPLAELLSQKFKAEEAKNAADEKLNEFITLNYDTIFKNRKEVVLPEGTVQLTKKEALIFEDYCNFHRSELRNMAEDEDFQEFLKVEYGKSAINQLLDIDRVTAVVKAGKTNDWFKFLGIVGYSETESVSIKKPKTVKKTK